MENIQQATGNWETYDIRVGLYLKGERLSIINKEVSDGEDRAIIGKITVIQKRKKKWGRS